MFSKRGKALIDAKDENHEDCNLEEIATEEDLIQVYGKSSQKKKNIFQQATKKLKSIFSFSGPKAKRIFNSVVPISKWLPTYKIKQNLFGDIVGGMTVGIVHLPQAMAYSILASMPAVTGLYVSFFPVLMYSIFGTTNHLSIGTFAVVSIMIGAVIDNHVPQNYCEANNAETSSLTSLATTSEDNNSTTFPFATSNYVNASLADCQIEQRKIEIAVALSLAIAIIHFAMYAFRLGIVTIYLSSNMVSGFTCGAAFHVLTSQISKLLGLKISRKSGVFSVVNTWIEVLIFITEVNWATIIVSLCCVIPLVLGKEINSKLKKKLPFPLPWELVVVIIATLSSQFGHLNSTYDVNIVGDIPQGIKTSVPSMTDVGNVFGDGVPIAIVIFSVSVSLSRLFAEKHAYTVDSNQELFAFGIANLVGSFFQCFPCAASLSRSVIWEETGGNTQLAGFVSSAVILVILLWLGPYFQALPEATLAAIIVVNLKRLLCQFSQLKPLWEVSKLDAITWFVTWISVVLFGVDLGLYVGVGFSMFTVVFRTQITQGINLVAVGGTNIYRNSKQFQGKVNKAIIVFKFPSPLIYANQERFKNELYAKLGFTPAVEVARRDQLKHTVSKRRSLEELDLKTEPSVIINQGFSQNNQLNHRPTTSTKQRVDVSQKETLKINSNKKTSYNCPAEAICIETETKRHLKAPAEHLTHLILDMSACSFIDYDGVKTLKNLYISLQKLDIQLFLVKCTDDVRKCILAGDFLLHSNDKTDVYPVFYISLKKAVAHARYQTTVVQTSAVRNRKQFVPTTETTRM